jgi:hypothetical protein
LLLRAAVFAFGNTRDSQTASGMPPKRRVHGDEGSSGAIAQPRRRKAFF